MARLHEALPPLEAFGRWRDSLGLARAVAQHGVLHVAAVHVDADGRRHIMKINASTPRSSVDRTLLEIARRWSDVILITGTILRDEPELSYDPWTPAECPSEFERWAATLRHRDDRSDAREHPTVAVLSSGRGLPSEHPLLNHPETVLITPPEGRSGLPGFPGRRLTLEGGGVREVVRLCREALGAARLSVEAGPTVARQFYEAPCLVDRLLLSEFRGTLPDAARGPAFVEASRLQACGAFGVEPRPVSGGSTAWRFGWWLKSTDAAEDGGDAVGES